MRSLCAAIHRGFIVACLLAPAAGVVFPWSAFAGDSESSKTNLVATQPGLPLLTNAVDVARLGSKEAERGYPVQISGVVICQVPEHNAFVLQDNTRGIYIIDSGTLPRVGERWKVTGVTDKGSFAPIIRARHKSFLGPGKLPKPVKPTWDQLMNGSLDDQLVEVRGVVESAQYDPNGWSSLELRVQAGSLHVDLPGSDVSSNELMQCQRNLVRIRGCLFVRTDLATRQAVVGIIRIYNARIIREHAGKGLSAQVPLKTAAELKRFDPLASAFRRVKVKGQVIYVGPGQQFMVDGTGGVRFSAPAGIKLRPGDLVEVTGFPRLGFGAPLLSEAQVRKMGHAALPKPKRLRADGLANATCDATLVEVSAFLRGVRQSGSNVVLNLESGSRKFQARMVGDSKAVSSLRPGSRLDLKGVYTAQGAVSAAGETVTEIKLLLENPGDIAVLAAPPWWTLRRLLMLVGTLVLVLTAALLWITQLRRQVEERTVQLKAEIHSRERAEYERALEHERARIARDLHDDLGAEVTELGMLARRAESAGIRNEERSHCLQRMTGKTAEMISALEGIVWAMNPQQDSLTSVISYFSFYADRFLGLANIKLRLDAPSVKESVPMEARRRHQLLLVFKEALANIVRHSGATEVRLVIQAADEELKVEIEDNGRGLSAAAPTEGQDGLINMRTRLEKIGGRFELSTQSAKGTLLRFHVPIYRKS